MKRVILLIFNILLVIVTNGQPSLGYVEVKGSIKLEKEGISGAKVDVKLNGKIITSHVCDNNGKFRCQIELNKEYEFVVHKEKYYSKIIVINTTVPAEDAGIYTYPFTAELIPFVEGFNAAIFDEPFGKVKFDDNFGDFNYDEDYTRKMQQRLRDRMRDYERLKKEAYTKLIAQADQAFNERDYDKAASLYETAIDLDPYDPYPDDQISAIGKLIAKDKDSQKFYDKAIAEADAYFVSQDFDKAKSAYTRALGYMENQYPKDKIAYIDNYIANQAQASADLATKEKAYNDAVAAGDRLFTSKQYDLSREKYMTASGIKPAEAYPKQKISEIDALLAQSAADKQKQEELNKAYAAAIASADAAFGQKNYESSRVDYVKASQLKPNETYPKSKIAEIDNILTASRSLTEQYNKWIAAADQAFGIKSYESAKNNYQEALKVKPNEVYPKQKISEIDALILAMKNQKQAELDAAYKQAVAQGDALFNKKDYQSAKDQYTQASTLKPVETYPKQKISEIDGILADAAAQKRAYDVAIAQADNFFNAENYNDAKVNYKKALGIYPTEPYPQSRLTEIENILLAQKSAAEQKAAREKSYNDAIAQGDAFFGQKQYVESKSAYTTALGIKPNEAYPKQKIDEIDKILQAQKALDDKYNGFIAAADQFFLTEKYTEARGQYNSALQLKPTEAYPKQKIAEIDALLNQMAADKKQREDLKKQFDALIVQADAQFNQKSWNQARQLYVQASGLIATEVYPKQRISEIDNLLAQQAATEQKYNEAIAKADNLFNTKTYGDALGFYNTALGIKPNETYPKQRISEINGILADLQKQEAAYDQYIKQADAAYSGKDLQTAQNAYQLASNIKPNEAYPKQRLAEIAALLAEKDKMLAEQARIDAEYKTQIAAADQLLSQQKYGEAKAGYQKALALKPNEMYPKEKLMDIDELLSKLADQETSYKNKMAEADALMTQKNYQSALAAFKQASLIKPSETLPKQKITEVEAILADLAKKQAEYDNNIKLADAAFNKNELTNAKTQYQAALTIKPGESYPTTQISKIDALVAEQQRLDAQKQAILQQYKLKIAAADKSFNAKSYDEALSFYMDAKGIKADETYPDEQILKINQLIAADKQLVENNYKQAMTKGDQFVAAKSYIEAKAQYQLALQYKPNDKVASNKLIELENLIAQQKSEQARLAEIEQKYNGFILQADNALKATDYASAIAMYKSALGVKPGEKYPTSQIELCERKIKEQQTLAAAEAEQKRKAELAAAQSSFNKGEFDYSGEKRDSKFLNDLAKQYPEGVTIENYDKSNKKIKRVIVNHDGIAKEYIEVEYSYGTFYFRNGQNISRSIFYSETRE